MVVIVELYASCNVSSKLQLQKKRTLLNQTPVQGVTVMHDYGGCQPPNKLEEEEDVDVEEEVDGDDDDSR